MFSWKIWISEAKLVWFQNTKSFRILLNLGKFWKWNRRCFGAFHAPKHLPYQQQIAKVSEKFKNVLLFWNPKFPPLQFRSCILWKAAFFAAQKYAYNSKAFSFLRKIFQNWLGLLCNFGRNEIIFTFDVQLEGRKHGLGRFYTAFFRVLTYDSPIMSKESGTQSCHHLVSVIWVSKLALISFFLKTFFFLRKCVQSLLRSRPGRPIYFFYPHISCMSEVPLPRRIADSNVFASSLDSGVVEKGN